MSSPVVCPQCGSAQLVTRDYARKACGTLGAIAGAAGASGAFDKQKSPERWLPAEAPGIGAGGFAVPLMKALLGGAAGCAAGASVGSTFDEFVLNNYECLSCGKTFSKSNYNF